MRMLPYRSLLLCLLVGLCLVLIPMISSAQAYRDNQTDYSNQDINTDTRRSDHFRLCFGHYNRDTGTPMTEQFVQGNLQMYEQMWNRWVNELGLHDINESATNPDGYKYRANFNFLMTWNDGGGGGAYSSMDGNGFFYAMSNASNCRYDPPSGTTPHEFGHVWEGSCGGFNGTDSSGAWWECTANWMQLQFLNSYPQAGGLIWNSMYYPAHGRDYYDSFAIWEAAKDDPRYGVAYVNKVWTDYNADQQAHEYIVDRMARVDTSGSLDKSGANRDLWGDMAKKCVTWDYERQRWLKQANSADDGSDWYFYQRCRTPLVKMPGATGWYRPERSHLPMEYGFGIIPLSVTAGTTMSCNFQPQCDPVRQSDWRACLVAVSNNGDARYSCLWNSGTNSMTLSADERKLYLVVIATPKPMKIADPAWRAYITDAGLQFPYAVSFTNASPKNVIYPVQSHTGMTQHANGGGWKSNTANVDATAYIGPNAQVLGYAQVRGNARIEDYAVVRDSAQIRDYAIVSGHGIVQDTAQVYGNAKVRDWARVFGSVEIYENGKVIEHANCGDGDTNTHTKVYGSAVVKGTTYVYNTSTLAGCLIMDGDSANGNGTTASDHGVHFGWGWGADTDRFNGLVDNGYIWAQHTFDKDNAVFAMDQYGINHGFMMNGCKVAKDTVAPTRGGLVLPLDGVSQYVELHNTVNDFKDTAITVWVKWTGTASDQKIWSMGDGSSQYMYLTPKDASTNKLRFVISDGTTTQALDGAAALSANVWTHVAITFSAPVFNTTTKQWAATGTLYVNGSQVASLAGMIVPDSLNAPLMENANYLGRGNAGNYFAGYLDDFRVYMKSLTAAEVSAVYATAAPAPVTIAADTTAPAPNAATWLVAPTAISDSAITMSATPGTDASGWVEYYFTCTSGGGHDSGWVSFNKYTDLGLAHGNEYTYTVKMRDRNANTTAPSTALSVTTQVSTISTPSFAYGPVGTSATTVKMTANKISSPSGLVEYNFEKRITFGNTLVGSSGWQSSPTWTDTSAGSSPCNYTVQARDARANVSDVSAPVTATGGDHAAPILPMTVAHWQMQPYATIDNKVCMTAQAVTETGLQVNYQCVSGGGPDSGWINVSSTDDGKNYYNRWSTPVMTDGTYSYHYKLRDAAGNESPYSVTYSATIKPTTGYHSYTFSQLAGLPDDTLARFTGIVTRVNSDHYIVSDTASGANIKVYPNTYAMVTNQSLLFKNVSVDGHMWTFGGVRAVTFATITTTGGGSTLLISGKVTNASGAGIAGATVYLSASPNAATSPICTATTDALGNYSRTIMDGTWYVAASADDYYPSADQTVTVSGSSVSNINFTLNLAPKVTGRVMDAGGVGISGAKVYFSKVANAVTNYTYTATTDSQGYYTKGIPNGTWYVAAGAAGYAPSADTTIVATGTPISGIDFTLIMGGDGLKGEYFDNTDFTSLKATRVDPFVNFDWTSAAPDPSMGVENFSVRWTGWVKPAYSQAYTFYTSSDDGVRLWVNDQLLVDNWTVHGTTEDSGTITLNANQWYKIKLEYFQGGGGAIIKLEWQSPSQYRQVIPQNRLCSATYAGSLVYGQVTDDVGSPLAGATVYISASPNASSGYAYTATSDFLGKYSKPLPNGTWYMAASKSGYITSADRMVTVNSANVPNINFGLMPTVVPATVFYNFDETSGTVALDSSGSGKNGTLTNGPAWVAGKINNAVDFDGIDDYVSVPALSQYNAITIAGWINMDSFGSDPTASSILSSDGSVTGGVQLLVLKATGQLRFGITGNTPAQVDSDTGLASTDLGKWRHVAVVYESAAGIVRFYINGSLVSTKTFTTPRSPLLTNALRVGGWSGGRYFDGKIDEFHIYREALSNSEIVDLVGVGAVSNIGIAKTLPDNEIVAFGSKLVTYAPRNANGRTTDFFYIEEPDRFAGIKVQCSAVGQDNATVDITASVSGIIKTNPITGERYIQAGTAASTGTPSVCKPMGTVVRSAIGDSITGGTLLKVVGKIKEIAQDKSWITIADGSTKDGQELLLKVVAQPGTTIVNYAVGNIIGATGVISMEGITYDNAKRVLLLRTLQRLYPATPPIPTPLVELDLTGLTSGALSSWTNTGSLGGSFDMSTNSAKPTVGTVGGKAAVTFDGGDRLQSSFTAPAGITGSSDFTVAYWAYNPGFAAEECVMSWAKRGGPGGTNAQMNFGNDPGYGAISHWSMDMGYYGGQPTSGAWHHIAVTYDGTTEKVYVDGVLNAQAGRSLSIGSGLKMFLGCAYTYSGTTYSPTLYYSGSLGPVRVFDTALTADLISALAGLTW